MPDRDDRGFDTDGRDDGLVLGFERDTEPEREPTLFDREVDDDRDRALLEREPLERTLGDLEPLLERTELFDEPAFDEPVFDEPVDLDCFCARTS